MKYLKTQKQLNESSENLNISDVRQRLFESEGSLYRSIKKYYKTFLISWLDDNDPDRDFGLQISQSEFIQDCVNMFGINGSEEYNSGYDDELVKKVCKQILDEEELKHKTMEHNQLNISDVSDSFINENKTQLEADVELKLIKFFEEFDDKFEIDRQWVVDRFNDKETENFINYVCNVLVKTTR